MRLVGLSVGNSVSSPVGGSVLLGKGPSVGISVNIEVGIKVENETVGEIDAASPIRPNDGSSDGVDVKSFVMSPT